MLHRRELPWTKEAAGKKCQISGKKIEVSKEMIMISQPGKRIQREGLWVRGRHEKHKRGAKVKQKLN